VWWSVALTVLVAATVAFWPAFKGASGISDAIGNLPPTVIDAFGLRDFGTPAGFLRGNLYELFVPLLLSIAAVALVNGQTAADETAGRLEIPLSQPVARRALFLARALACLTAVAAIAVVTIVVQIVFDNLVGLSIEAQRVVATAILCGLLAGVHGSVAYAIACLVARPSLVLAAGVGLTIGGYIVAALFPISTILEPWRVISPWSWALGSDPLVNGAEPWRFGLLAAVTAAALVAGTMVVARRDVAAA
jgi:ABC-2 type transport system permease protein